MANKYVDNATGDDTTGTGASGAPWKTLQKAIDNSTGGDTIWLADTQTFTLTAEITWGTGFGTASGDAPLIIRPWDNGGSKTIPHPSGTDLVAAEISGGGTVARPFSTTSIPSFVILYRLIFTNFTSNAVRTGTLWSILECELSNSGSASSFMLDCGSGSCKIFSNYLHTFPAGIGGMTSLITCHVMGNYIKNPKSHGINASGNNMIVNNIIYNCEEDGIRLTSDYNTVLSNTIIGNGTAASKRGIHITSANAETSALMSNLVMDFAGASSVGIYTASGAQIDLYGPNAFYNNTTNASFVSSQTGLNLSSLDVTDSGDPLEDKAGENFKVKVTANASNGSPFITGYLGTETEQITAFGATDSQESETGAIAIEAGNDNGSLGGDC